jgi:hypothetical protein
MTKSAAPAGFIPVLPMIKIATATPTRRAIERCHAMRIVSSPNAFYLPKRYFA